MSGKKNHKKRKRNTQGRDVISREQEISDSNKQYIIPDDQDLEFPKVKDEDHCGVGC